MTEPLLANPICTRSKPTREEAVALYSEVMALHHCQTLGEMAEHFAHAVLERWGQ